MLRLLLASLAVLLIGASPRAQSNTVPGLDVRVSDLAEIDALGRTGIFPNGMNGVALNTQVCNSGSVHVPWEEAMSPNHPFIAPLIASATDQRIVQISDRSYIKHGVNSQNLPCTDCQIPPTGGDMLGIGCLDTYKVIINGDSYWLGPPDEIDPYLGTWDPVCSHFDRGEPAAAPPADCDGVRSLTFEQVNALGPLGHRILLKDADLNVPEGTLWLQAQYVILGEAEALRDDNVASRGFNSVWNGSSWDLTPSGTLVTGSVLGRWNGASLTSGTNGLDDGRVFVAAKVTGPVDGLWHYEYAVHNRDNARGVSSFRLPICDDARVLAAGFRDIDDNPTQDWTVTRPSGELVWSTTANPLRWNTIFNFWFDSDAGPSAGSIGMDAFAPGPGSSAFNVAGTVPGELWNVYLGDGCSTGPSPTLHAVGSPPRATIGNASFGLESTGNEAGQVNLLFYSLTDGSFPLAGCTVWMGAAPIQTSSVLADATGRAMHAVPIPPDPGLEGTTVNAQCVGLRPGGALLGFAELSAGLQVRIGSSGNPCP